MKKFFIIVILFLSVLPVRGQQDRFNNDLIESVKPLAGLALDVGGQQGGAAGVQEFLISLGNNIIIPIVIVFGILLSIIGFYKIMVAEDDSSISSGINYILWGVIGTIIMMSANYIGTTFYDTILNKGDLGVFNGTAGSLGGTAMISKIYDFLIYPFIKVFVYLGLGILFVILLINVFKYITNPSDDIKEKARNIIVYNIIGLLLIIGSDALVTSIFGSRQDVVKNAQSTLDIGSSIFEGQNFSFIIDILNRALGFILLAIVLIIIYQGYNLLINPDSEDNLKKIKNTIIYGLAGILVIGASYLITNFLIITQ